MKRLVLTFACVVLALGPALARAETAADKVTLRTTEVCVDQEIAERRRIEAELRHNTDIAALMLEPSGASWGTVPLTAEFNRSLRVLTERYGVRRNGSLSARPATRGAR